MKKNKIPELIDDIRVYGGELPVGAAETIERIIKRYGGEKPEALEQIISANKQALFEILYNSARLQTQIIVLEDLLAHKLKEGKEQ